MPLSTRVNKRVAIMIGVCQLVVFAGVIYLFSATLTRVRERVEENQRCKGTVTIVFDEPISGWLPPRAQDSGAGTDK